MMTIVANDVVQARAFFMQRLVCFLLHTLQLFLHHQVRVKRLQQCHIFLQPELDLAIFVVSFVTNLDQHRHEVV
jgi:hypothetical protein